MLVNLLSPVEAMDADGTIIKNKDGEIPTLKEMILYALRVPHGTDQNTNYKTKNERFLLLKRIDKVDEIELTDAECKSILDRIGMIYLQVEMVGRCGELLTPPVKTKAPVELKEVVQAEEPAK